MLQTSPLPLHSVLFHLTSKSNFRIRLLLGCHGLESDISRFRVCGIMDSRVLEDATHFILTCTMLETKCRELLSYIPPSNPATWTYLTPHVSQIALPVLRTRILKRYFRGNSCWTYSGIPSLILPDTFDGECIDSQTCKFATNVLWL